MPATTNQVRLDFDKITERGLSQILNLFQKHKLPVTKVEATNKAKRESGFLLKDVSLYFDDGQKVFVRIKADGTVFQVKLNNKVVPIRHVDDMGKAVVEVCDYVDGNRKKFEAAKVQREKRKKLDLDVQPVRTSRAEKIEQMQAALAEVQGEVSSGQREADDKEKALEGSRSSLAELEAQLATEVEKTGQLEAELKEVTKEAA